MAYDEARDMGRLLGMKNIGVDTATRLYAAGIRNPGALRRAGAEEAYRRVSEYFGESDRELLYILKGAITGKKWFQVR